MRYIQCILLLLIFTFLFNACTEDTATGLNYSTIEGKVTDAETNEPLANVELFTTPSTSVHVTTQTGYYQFKDVVPGIYKITARKFGYKSKTVDVLVQSGKMTKSDIILEKLNGGTDDPDIGSDTTKINFDNYLVVHYEFNSNSQDSGPNKKHGMTNSVNYTNDRKGNANSAIQFSGSYFSYVVVNDIDIFNLSEFTYSCWLKPNSNFGTAYNGFIDFLSRWGQWGSYAQSFAFSLGSSGKLKGMLYEMKHSDWAHPSNYTFFETNQTIKSDSWSHVAITFQSDQLSIYINGELILNTFSVSPQSSKLYGLTIGKRPDENQNSYYSGAMDDLRLYKVALNANQVKQLFNIF